MSIDDSVDEDPRNKEDLQRIAARESFIHHGGGSTGENYRAPGVVLSRVDMRDFGMHLIGPEGERSKPQYQPPGNDGVVKKY